MPAEPRLGTELIRLTRRCRSIDKHVSASAGLSIDEMHCLSSLFAESPSSVKTLSDLISVNPTRASKILRDLEERGLLSRTIDVSDRR
jgi:DNA-binding MarR family transcriptional regulator